MLDFRPYCLAALLLVASNCAQLDQQSALDPRLKYRYDLPLTIHSITYSGIAVVTQAPRHDLTVQSEDRLSALKLITCHREKLIKNPPKKYTFQFSFSHLERLCPLRIEALAKNGRHRFALIDSESDAHALPARLHCNGETTKAIGVSVCQARAGLTQSIVFENEVSFRVNGECEIKTKDQKVFTYSAVSGECYLAFMEKSPPHRTHRHTSLGYDEIVF